MPKIEMYTTASCAFCTAAKMLLKQKGLDYAEIRVDTDLAKREEMLQRAHRRPVPQIFINDQHIGGFEELAAAAKDGKLAKLTGSAT